jgi:hypothetical protein
MNTTQQNFQKIQQLNETSQSQHVLTLFRKVKAPQETELILASLLFWAQTNLTDLDWNWMEQVTGAAAQALDKNPQALYRNLESPRLMDAESLEEAAMICLEQVADQIPPQDSPSSRYQ